MSSFVRAAAPRPQRGRTSPSKLPPACLAEKFSDVFGPWRGDDVIDLLPEPPPLLELLLEPLLLYVPDHIHWRTLSSPPPTNNFAISAAEAVHIAR